MRKITKDRLSIGLIITNLILLIILTANLMVIDWLNRSIGSPKIGVSFSQKYAQELGIDWQTAYTSLLNDLHVKRLRLMSYWDIHEPKVGQYDFGPLDWQMNQASRHGVEVILVVGVRQPRWPECHLPEWAASLSESESYRQLLIYIQKVVERYQNHPSLSAWQLENEPANKLFGNCSDWNPEFYQAEFELIRQLDSAHPIYTTTSNQTGVPIKPPFGDRVGFSIYRQAYPQIAGRAMRWSYWYMPPAWHSLRAAAIDKLHSVPTYIHELQTEPWGPKATNKLSIDSQNQLMNPHKLTEHVDYALGTGIDEMYLWGAEWWYWRKIKFGDPAMWDSVKDVLVRSSGPSTH